MTRTDKVFMAVIEFITLNKAKICCKLTDLNKINEILTKSDF